MHPARLGRFGTSSHWTELDHMKKVVIGVVVLFVGFWMVQSPDSLAEFTRDGATVAWDGTSAFFRSLIDFLGSVFD
jgi:hypothetical protein